MKNLFAKLMLPVALAASTVSATPEKQEPSLAPKYSNRVVALQPTVSYERLGDDSVYVGVESFVTGAWRGENDYTKIGLIEARVGYTFAFDARSRVTPVIGGSLFQDLEKGTAYHTHRWDEKNSESREVTYTHPYLFHGHLGLMAEYDISRTLTFGVNAKGLMGKVWGSNQNNIKDLSYGLNTSIPVTFRFGKEFNWDLRIEPIAILLKDYNNYIGGKAAVAYRF